MVVSQNIKNLNILIHEKKISEKDLIDLFCVGKSAIEAYRRGTRNLSIDKGILIADKYNVSLDWLYGRSEHSCEYDVMSSIVFSLRKIFCVRKDVKSGYPVLLIDRTFCDYLEEIQKLRTEKMMGGLDDVWFEKRFKNIYDRYITYFQTMLESTGFNEDKAMKILFAEDLVAIDYLANAMIKKEQSG